MDMSEEIYQKVEKIAHKDGRYKVEAYLFVLGAFQYTLKKLRRKRDITGRDLLEGIKTLGVERYGPTTRLVFEHWGVRTTEDFGRVVFNMVEAGLMKKTEEDTIEDFKGVYSFQEEFDRKFKFRVDKDSL